MSYDTTVSIGITVKDGPPVPPQKAVLDGVNLAGSQRLEFKPAASGCKADSGTHGWLPPQSVDLTTVGGLVFVAISADKYTYKDECGEEVKGVRFKLDGETEQRCIDSARVYVAMDGHPLDKFKTLSIEVHDKMFDHTKPADKQKFRATITYGSDGKKTGSQPDPSSPKK